MGIPDLHVRARRLVTGDGERLASFVVEDGRIAHVGTFHDRVVARTELEFGPNVAILPGLVDTHVHICEPGHADWEGFATATRAAAAGGITTLVDMPVDSSPATTTVAALRAKRAAATNQS